MEFGYILYKLRYLWEGSVSVDAKDYRELYIRGILDLAEEHGLDYRRIVLEQMAEKDLIELRDALRMKHGNINFKRFC